MSNKRGPKVKVPLAPSGNFIALGTSSAPSSASSSVSGIKSAKRDIQSSTSSGPSVPNAAAGGGVSSAKRSKLSLSHHMTRSSGKMNYLFDNIESRDSSSGAIQIRRESGEHWEEFAHEVEAHHLLTRVFEAEDVSDERVEALLCGAVKQLRTLRSRPSVTPELLALYLTLCYLAKTRPLLFCTEIVVEAFCSLLKRDATVNFKTKANPNNNHLVSVLAANLLLAAYHDESSWPDTFLKVYIEDSLGERVWVDHDDCKGFVDNILASFNTKLPPKNMLQQDVLQTVIPLGKSTETTGSPNHPNVTSVSTAPVSSSAEESPDDSSSHTGHSMTSEMSDHLANISVTTRFTHNEEFVNGYVTEVINEQLTRKQAPSEISRNMLKLLAATSGISSVRFIVTQKLEMWLQNAKLTRPAQDLLLTICLNCNEMDTEVIQTLVKMRPKTKPLFNHYMMCIKEMLNQNDNSLRLVLRTVIHNELSPARSLNNMQIVSAVFQQSSEKATRFLAEIFLEMLAAKEDFLRSLRTLLREIVRTLKYEHINFQLLAVCFTEENHVFTDLDPNEFAIRERAVLSITDLLTLIMFLSISPLVREAMSTTKPDRRDVIRNFQLQISNIQRIAVQWLQTTVIKVYRPDRGEFLHSLNKVLFMETADNYYSKDNWPQENDRNFMFRMASEVPLLEDTLMRVLTMGNAKDNPLTPSEAIELSDALIKRAASITDGDIMTYPVLLINNKEIFTMLMNLAVYRHPENIALPSGYDPPNMAISEMYWKVWIQMVILTAHNPMSFGLYAWEHYPTLAVLIDISITNHFEFPPPTRQTEDLINRDLQIGAFEKQQILQFESYLAAASTKVQINESNSLLLSKLITMDPHGAARKPPSQVLEHFKSFSTHLRLGYLLCQSRNPDFLLEIIQRQQKQIGSSASASSSMPWLVELVESNENNFGMLPVQCLCEFLLGQIDDDADSLMPLHEISKQEKSKKREKRRKQLKLTLHLQNVISHSSNGAKELIDYFMKKLNSRQSNARALASKALSLVLDTDIVNYNEEKLQMICSITGNESQYEDTKLWLNNRLPMTENFEHIKPAACESLRSALLVETVPSLVCLYTQFLSIYDLNGDSDLTLQIAHLLIDRQTIVNFLLQHNEHRDILIDSVTRIFYSHLTVMRRPAHEIYTWSNAQDHVLVQWKNEAANLNILVVHAMILLLTFGPTQTHGKMYDYILESWFCEPPPQAYLEDTSEEALLIPDWLRLKMLRSSFTRLVDAALKDTEPSQLILFIQSFGLPISSMESLFEQLDIAVEVIPEAVRSVAIDESIIYPLIDVQWMRGVKTGKIFAQFIGYKSNDNEIKFDSNDKSQSQLSNVKESSEEIIDANNLNREFNIWIKNRDYDKHFLRKLSRVITQELFDKKITKKTITKHLLILLSSRDNLQQIIDLFNSGAMNSVCNIIVTFVTRDANYLGIGDELKFAKKQILECDIQNQTVLHVFERFTETREISNLNEMKRIYLKSFKRI